MVARRLENGPYGTSDPEVEGNPGGKKRAEPGGLGMDSSPEARK